MAHVGQEPGLGPLGRLRPLQRLPQASRHVFGAARVIHQLPSRQADYRQHEGERRDRSDDHDLPRRVVGARQGALPLNQHPRLAVAKTRYVALGFSHLGRLRGGRRRDPPARQRCGHLRLGDRQSPRPAQPTDSGGGANLIGRVVEGVGGQALDRMIHPAPALLERDRVSRVVGADDACEGVLLVVRRVEHGIGPGQFVPSLGHASARALDEVDIDPDDRRHRQHGRDQPAEGQSEIADTSASRCGLHESAPVLDGAIFGPRG